MPLLEPLHPIDAGVLNIAYHQAGPADGPPVLLMHGFPYDIHAYAEVAPQGLALLGVGLLAVDARSLGRAHHLVAGDLIGGHPTSTAGAGGHRSSATGTDSFG